MTKNKDPSITMEGYLIVVCVPSEMFLPIISLSQIFAKVLDKSHHSYLQNTPQGISVSRRLAPNI